MAAPADIFFRSHISLKTILEFRFNSRPGSSGSYFLIPTSYVVSLSSSPFSSRVPGWLAGWLFAPLNHILRSLFIIFHKKLKTPTSWYILAGLRSSSSARAHRASQSSQVSQTDVWYYRQELRAGCLAIGAPAERNKLYAS